MSSGKPPINVTMAARLFHEANEAGKKIDALPPEALPQSEEEADAIQDEVARLTGPVCAWKVGAATPHSTPSRAPIHAKTLFLDPGHIPAAMFSHIGAEAEIVYKFSKDLVSNGTALSLEEILDAVESIHPAIEILDTRFPKLGSQPPLAHRADQGNHGALIVGAPIANWRSISPQTQRVILEINGEVASDKIDGNTAGNPENLLVWLANQGAKSLGGIKAGQYVTTGSCSGTIMVTAPVQLKATLAGYGSLSLTIDTSKP